MTKNPNGKKTNHLETMHERIQKHLGILGIPLTQEQLDQLVRRAETEHLSNAITIFDILAHQWREQKKDPRHTHVKVALRFCRIAYQIVAGRQVFHHPCLQERHYVLAKLIAFQREHDTGSVESLNDLQAALAHVPQREHRAEAKPLHEELDRIQRGGRHGPQLLGDILPIVLARLGVGEVQSSASGEEDPA